MLKLLTYFWMSDYRMKFLFVISSMRSLITLVLYLGVKSFMKSSYSVCSFLVKWVDITNLIIYWRNGFDSFRLSMAVLQRLIFLLYSLTSLFNSSR